MMGRSNLGLIVPRQCKEEPGALVSRWIAGHKAVSAYDVNSLFPLYLDAGEVRRPNIAPALERRLAELYGAAQGPETILGYVYAVLYSATYRHRFRELLRRSFPRVRFPGDPQLFTAVAGLGCELIGLHLLQDARLQKATPRLVGGAGRPVAQGRLRRYSEVDRTLYLAEDGLALVDIGPEVWQYRIGGYRVLGQWLQARAGRVLRGEERCELPQIAEALRLTLEVQTRIGEVLGS